MVVKQTFVSGQILVNSLYVLLQVDQGVLEELIDKELPTLGTKVLKTFGATQMIVSDIYFFWGMVILFFGCASSATQPQIVVIFNFDVVVAGGGIHKLMSVH